MRGALKILCAVALTITPLMVPPVPSVAAFKYLHTGMTAPTVEGKDILTGERVSSEDRTGAENEATCIAFWATWSPRSIELLADLKEIYTRLEGSPLRIIAVNVDSQVTTSEVVSRVRGTLEDLAIPFPSIMDEELKTFYEFGVVAVPSMAIVDAEGMTVGTPSGYSYTVRDRLPEMIEVALGLREPQEQVAAVKTGRRPDPRASRYYHLAVQLTNQAQFESALKKLDIAVEADSMFSAPLNLRGHIQLELGDTEAALESFRQAIALDSASVAAHAGMGRALLEDEDTTAAKAELEVALDLEPSYPAALRDLGACLAARGDYAGAISTLTGAIELNPRDPELYYHLGRVYRMHGHTADALDAFHTALRMRFPGP